MSESQFSVLFGDFRDKKRHLHLGPRTGTELEPVRRRFALILSLAALLAMPLAAFARKRSHARSPHVEVAAVARVETPPQRIVHENGRTFEELDVRILSAEKTGERTDKKDENVTIDVSRPVHVVHDLSCGGSWLDAKPGDRVEIKGEYVHPPRGADLIHFTHPADGSCGTASGHPNGYFRMAPAQISSTEASTSDPPDLFRTAVRPVLARRCLCHEQGGKMYTKLPFDDPTVLSSYAGGVRRRLKGDDLATFERWLATLPSPGS